MFFMLKICDNDLTVQSSGGGRRKRIFKLLYCTRASMRAPIHIYTHLVTECAIHAGGVNASDPSTVNGQTSIYPRFLPLSGCNFTDPKTYQKTLLSISSSSLLFFFSFACRSPAECMLGTYTQAYTHDTHRSYACTYTGVITLARSCRGYLFKRAKGPWPLTDASLSSRIAVFHAVSAF